jgi:SAM-dependent methyltransferase
MPRRAGAANLPNVVAIQEAVANIHPSDPRLDDWYANYAAFHEERLAIDLGLLPQLPGVEILDIGSSPPILLAALKRRGCSAAGVDVAPDRFADVIAALGLDIRRCDIEQEALPFPDASFDVVLLNEVFEHLRVNPIRTIREIHRVLRPGGILSLSTPNARSVEGLINLAVRDRSGWCATSVYEEYEKLERLGHMGHVREYTASEIRDFLERLCFRVIKVVWRGTPKRGASLVTRMVPSLSPFMTLVATRGQPSG